MGRLIGFLSFVALALLAAGALGVAGLGPLAEHASAKANVTASPASFALDMKSLLAGTVLGVALSHLGRFQWAEIPRRAIAWLFANERNLVRCAWGAMFLGVVLFY